MRRSPFTSTTWMIRIFKKVAWFQDLVEGMDHMLVMMENPHFMGGVVPYKGDQVQPHIVGKVVP